MNIPIDASSKKKIGVFPFVIGGMSFIPLLGLLFGLIAIIWGITTRKYGGKRLIVIGIGGVVFTLVLFGALFYFGFIQRGGIYDELRMKQGQSAVNSLAQAIEAYRLKLGSYPESLKVLQESFPKESLISINDPTNIPFGGQSKYFYYERVGNDHYYLRAIGSDGKPFTEDDIIPQVFGIQINGLLLDSGEKSSILNSTAPSPTTTPPGRSAD